MPRGGKRDGAGRRKGQTAKIPTGDIGEEFVKAVFARIHEGPPKEIKTPVDYQLSLLSENDVQTRSYNFNKLLDRRYGKPMIRVAANVSGLEGLAERMAEARKRLDRK